MVILVGTLVLALAHQGPRNGQKMDWNFSEPAQNAGLQLLILLSHVETMGGRGKEKTDAEQPG